MRLDPSVESICREKWKKSIDDSIASFLSFSHGQDPNQDQEINERLIMYKRNPRASPYQRGSSNAKTSTPISLFGSDPFIRSRRGSPRLTWGPRPRWRAARRYASPSHYRWPRCLSWLSRRFSPGHRYCCPLQPRNPLARPPIHVPNLLLRRGTSSVVAIL